MGPFKSTIAPSGILSMKPTGMLYVEVLNALRNPTTAANSIEFLVETCAGTDFQFGFFTDHDSYEPIYGPPVAAKKLMPRVQMMGDDGKCKPFFPSCDMKSYTPNIYGMGEAITSLRQILKRYHKLVNGSLPVPTGGKHTAIFPFYDGNGNGHSENVYDYISLLYRMRCGSLRLGIVPTTSNATNMEFTIIPYSSVSTTSAFVDVNPDYFPQAKTGRPLNFLFPLQEALIELDVPFYQNYPAMPTGTGNMKIATDLFEGANLGVNLVPFNEGTQVIVTKQNAALDIYRSIGEDFSFGYLIGPPMRTWTPA